ncbi:carbohydrate isomerase, partial [Clostridioides difficile]|nr:carbohydrate isomerase [Clostridioides difficile]
MENTLSEFLDNISNELSEFIASIDETSINKACELILEAEKNHGRVHVTGI